MSEDGDNEQKVNKNATSPQKEAIESPIKWKELD
jgi:LPS O-antigen subunit length determinant protein (WzzB/FepE family)